MVERGGGGFRNPHGISRTTILGNKQQTALGGLQRYLKTFAQVIFRANIEVTRGHQRSNFEKIAIFWQTMAINSKSMIARKNSKRHLIALFVPQ